MKDYQVLLFDLDGTLTDSGEGIMRSVQYALRTVGIDVMDYRTLTAFIGPPASGFVPGGIRAGRGDGAAGNPRLPRAVRIGRHPGKRGL